MIKANIKSIKNQKIILTPIDILKAQQNSNLKLNKLLPKNFASSDLMKPKKKINGILELSLKLKNDEEFKLLLNSRLNTYKQNIKFNDWKDKNLYINVVGNDQMNDTCKEKLLSLIQKSKSMEPKATNRSSKREEQNIQEWVKKLLQDVPLTKTQKNKKSFLHPSSHKKRSNFKKLSQASLAKNDISIISENLFQSRMSHNMMNSNDIEESLYNSIISNDMKSIRESIHFANDFDNISSNNRDSIMQSIQESIFSNVNSKKSPSIYSKKFYSRQSHSSKKISCFKKTHISSLKKEQYGANAISNFKPNVERSLPQENVKMVEIEKENIIEYQQQRAKDISSEKKRKISNDFFKHIKPGFIGRLYKKKTN